METKYGFTKLTIAEFEQWIQQQRVARTILNVQQHHTWSPNYSHFNGNNHFERQKAMKDYHVRNNGWADIGQHFSTFPDGTIMTGRPLERSPACIYMQNANSVCIESMGNFDSGGDTMTPQQRDTIVKMTALLCKKFNIPVTTTGIVYHHWFNLNTGERNNGTGTNKSCPGSNFFGGNKVQDCEQHFLPLVRTALGGGVVVAPVQTPPALLKYVLVTASRLNVRTGPGTSHAIASNRAAAEMGAVLRIYEEKDGWLKISDSQPHWVFARFTMDVRRATVNANALNVRSGPGTQFAKVASLMKDEEVFVTEESNGWCKVGLDEQWVSKSFLNF
jgi:uncharacterized protein YgiM (DUF1202 family)